MCWTQGRFWCRVTRGRGPKGEPLLPPRSGVRIPGLAVCSAKAKARPSRKGRGVPATCRRTPSGCRVVPGKDGSVRSPGWVGCDVNENRGAAFPAASDEVAERDHQEKPQGRARDASAFCRRGAKPRAGGCRRTHPNSEPDRPVGGCVLGRHPLLIAKTPGVSL